MNKGKDNEKWKLLLSKEHYNSLFGIFAGAEWNG